MARRTKSETRYSAPALEKGLDIIELLSEHNAGLTQSQMARSLSRSPSEIFRMVTCLEERGYILRGPSDDLYRLTTKLFELAHQHPPVKQLLEVALPHMREFSRQAEQSCHLAIRHGENALIAAQVDGPGFLSFSVRVGAQIALSASCSGTVLLAFQERDIREAWLREAGVELATDQGKALLSKITRVKEQGFFDMPSPTAHGITDVSAPILEARGSAVAALTVPHLSRIKDSGSPSVSAVREMLILAAKNISQEIGGPTDNSTPS